MGLRCEVRRVIVARSLISKVLDGKKTQTREIVKPGEVVCRYRKDRVYAVQSAAGRPGIVPVVVLAVRRQHLGAITLLEAIAEGHKTRQQFFDRWAEDHPDGPCPVALEVWAVEFRLAKEQRPRYLARGAGSDGRGYTETSARAIDPLEAVDDTYLKTLSSWSPPPEPAPVARNPSITDEAERILREQLLVHEGREAEDVYALTNGRLGTPGEIRRRRREMGLRGTDGLPPLAAHELAEIQERMLAEGRSAGDLALVLDCSRSKAHNLIVQYHASEQEAA